MEKKNLTVKLEKEISPKNLLSPDSNVEMLHSHFRSKKNSV